MTHYVNHNLAREWRVAEALYNRWNVITHANDAPQLRQLRPTVLQTQWLSLAQAAIREVSR